MQYVGVSAKDTHDSHALPLNFHFYNLNFTISHDTEVEFKTKSYIGFHFY